MSYIDTEIMLLNKILEVLLEEVTNDYDSFEYQVSMNSKEGWSESSFYVIEKKIKFSTHFSDEGGDKLSDLTDDLHTFMKEHTGGDWSRLIFTYDKSCGVKTKFEYD